MVLDEAGELAQVEEWDFDEEEDFIELLGPWTSTDESDPEDQDDFVVVDEAA